MASRQEPVACTCCGCRRENLFLAFQIAAIAEGSVVYLNFEAFLWKAAFLVGSVEVNTGVTALLSDQLHFELEVSEVCGAERTRIKQMRTRSIC